MRFHESPRWPVIHQRDSVGLVFLTQAITELEARMGDSKKCDSKAATPATEDAAALAISKVTVALGGETCDAVVCQAAVCCCWTACSNPESLVLSPTPTSCPFISVLPMGAFVSQVQNSVLATGRTSLKWSPSAPSLELQCLGTMGH